MSPARAYGTDSRKLAYELGSKAVSREFLGGPNGGEALIDGIADLAGRFVSPEVFCDACDALINVDVTGDLAEVRAPTLVMAGGMDMLTPAVPGPQGAGAHFIYGGLTGVPFKEYVELEGSAHAKLMDTPDEYMAAIIPVLRRVGV